MKVVINSYYGGFGLSEEAKEWMAKKESSIPNIRTISRHDPILVECVETLKEKANDTASRLKVVEIPDDVKYQIEEYSGWEHIAEVHRTWE